MSDTGYVPAVTAQGGGGGQQRKPVLQFLCFLVGTGEAIVDVLSVCACSVHAR